MRKVRYTGDAPEITLRGVTFKKGAPVDLAGDPDLFDKVKVLDFFAEVKPGRPRKRGNDKDKP